MPEAFTLRPVTAADESFLKRMAYVAVFSINGELTIPDGLTLDTVQRADWYNKNTIRWGCEGDYGLIAVDARSCDIGAAWYRRHLVQDLPEYMLEIGVEPSHQVRKGVGKALLEGLIRHADSEGVELGLTVNPHNTRASGFYRRLGFIGVGEYQGFDVMKLPGAAVRG